MLMQTFNLMHLLNEELERFVLEMSEIKKVSFDHFDQLLQEIDYTYPFTMPG